MTLIKWTNKRPVSIFDEFDNIFNNMHIGLPAIFNREHSWSPQFEVLNTDKAYIVRGDLRGVSKKDVSIEVDDNVLKISGERKNNYSKENSEYNYTNVAYGKFLKSFDLPDDVKQDNIKANMKDGVLSLEIPRMEVVKNDVKKIAIK